MRIFLSIVPVFWAAGCGENTVEPCAASELAWPTEASCFFGEHATFLSEDTLEGGLSTLPGRSTAFHWKLVFDRGAFSWSYSDVLETVDYACDRNVISTPTPPTTFQGVWDPAERILLWEGVRYIPICDVETL